MLELTVEMPSPRTASSLLHLRKNVELFVQSLLHCQGTMPPISASIHGVSYGSLSYTYNDFAMVLGPLGRLCNVRMLMAVSFGGGEPRSLQRSLANALRFMANSASVVFSRP